MPREQVLLRSRVAAGVGRWDEVQSLAREVAGADTAADFLPLLAQSYEATEDWAAAERAYRRLAALASAPADLRSRALVRRASALSALGQVESAESAWRLVALALPEIADWANLRRAAYERDTAAAFATVGSARTPGSRLQSDLFVAQRRLGARNRRGALEVYWRLGRLLDIARMEFELGLTRPPRWVADSILFADATRPLALLAANFLAAHYRKLTVREQTAIARAYRARGDPRAATQYLHRALAEADTSASLWLELAGVESEAGNLAAALEAIGRAERRLGRRGAGPVAAARLTALARAGRWDEVQEMVPRLPRSYAGDSSVARAILLVAERDRVSGETAEEQGKYAALVQFFPDAPATNVARYRAGLLAYALDRPGEAAVAFGEIVERDASGALGLGPRYWDARLRAERGDSLAVARLAGVAAADRTGFYGVRARQLLGLPTLVSSAPVPRPRPGSFPPTLARARLGLLARVGLIAEARAEAMGWVGDTTASARLLIAAGEAAAEAGLARESIRLGLAALGRGRMTVGVARLVFPLPWRAVIEAEADEHCVDPLLMAAIIRQESRFEPRAVSRAGARGISQIMPGTGAEMARRLRLDPWHPDLLFTPDMNLHLGSRYIADRLGAEGLPVYAAVAAYNAGPTRIRSWRARPEFNDLDLFAERISNPETHDYVKAVYANYIWYQEAYRR